MNRSSFNVGDFVTGVVTGIEKYGIFLSIDDSNFTGLIHISEISSSFVRNVSDYAELNEKITARVVGIDDVNKKLKLSVKDFKYRDNSRYSSGIKETKSGFSNLKIALNHWLKSKDL